MVGKSAFLCSCRTLLFVSSQCSLIPFPTGNTTSMPTPSPFPASTATTASRQPDFAMASDTLRPGTASVMENRNDGIWCKAKGKQQRRAAKSAAVKR